MNYLLQLLILVLPWLALTPWERVFGVPGGYIYVALTGLFVIALLANKPVLKWEKIKSTPLLIPMLVFIGANVLSLLWVVLFKGTNALGANNLKELAYLIFAVGYYWSIVNFLDSSENLLSSIKVFLFSFTLAALYGIGKLLLFMNDSPLGYAQPWTVPRLVAPAGEAQVMGGLIITVLPLAVAVVLYRIKGFGVVSGFLSCLVLLFTMVATFSAGAWVGFAVALVILLAWLPFYDFRQALSLLMVFVFVSSAVYLIDRNLSPGYLKGFDSITVKLTGKPRHISVKPDPQEGRLKLETPDALKENVPQSGGTRDISKSADAKALKYQESVFSKVERSWFRAALWNMFKSSPVFGVGPGNFEKLYDQFRPGDTPQLPYTPKPHNQYLEILAETGLVGALAFLLIIVNLLVLLYQQWFALSENGQKIALGLFACLTAIAVQGYVFGILVHIQLWLLLALTVSAITICGGNGINIYRGAIR